jgi:hypothetical protein
MLTGTQDFRIEVIGAASNIWLIWRSVHLGYPKWFRSVQG